MLAGEDLCCRVHCHGIEWTPRKQTRCGRAWPQRVSRIGSDTCARVRCNARGVVGDRPSPQHSYVCRSLAVGPIHPRAFGALDARLEVCHLCERVHAGVGATAAVSRTGCAATCASADCSSPCTVRACGWVLPARTPCVYSSPTATRDNLVTGALRARLDMSVGPPASRRVAFLQDFFKDAARRLPDRPCRYRARARSSLVPTSSSSRLLAERESRCSSGPAPAGYASSR